MCVCVCVQPVWEAVVGFDPQVFIWLGDNVYGDNKRPFRVFGRERTVGPWRNVPRFYPSTEAELRRRYEMAKAKPGYAKLRERAQVRACARLAAALSLFFVFFLLHW